MAMTQNSDERKDIPIYSGFVCYFPDAMAAVAHLSQVANEKHNPGEPLHWSKDKSNDHMDCLMRHATEHQKYDGSDGFLHAVKVAWRGMANLQVLLDSGTQPRLPESSLLIR